MPQRVARSHAPGAGGARLRGVVGRRRTGLQSPAQPRRIAPSTPRGPRGRGLYPRPPLSLSDLSRYLDRLLLVGLGIEEGDAWAPVPKKNRCGVGAIRLPEGRPGGMAQLVRVPVGDFCELACAGNSPTVGVDIVAFSRLALGLGGPVCARTVAARERREARLCVPGLPLAG